MLGEIEAGFFDFRRWAETDDGFDDVGDDGGGNHAPDNGQADGLELLQEQTILEWSDHRVGLLIGEDTGEDRAQGATHTVDAEGVESVIVAEQFLEIGDGEEWNHPGENAHDHC